MTWLLRRLVGETLEKRFVFIIAILVAIALISLIIVVIQHTHAQLWVDIGQRTTVRLMTFQQVLEGRSALWAEDVLRTMNRYGAIQGSVMFLWLADGKTMAGTKLKIPKLTEENLDSTRFPKETTIDGEACLLWSVKIKLEKTQGARLVIAHSRGAIERRLVALLFKMLLIAISLIILSYFVGRNLASSVLRPLKRFSGAMERVAQGEYPHEERRADVDEMGRWADTFNAMVKQLHDKHTLEKLLYEQEKMASVGHLAASVAHEIRNPLASINSLTQLIGEMHEDDPKLQEYTSVILKEVERLNAAIQQLLTFSRPVPAQFKQTKLSDILEGVFVLLGFEAQQCGVRLALDFEVDEEVPVLGDANQLKQVFINLITNSIHAQRDNGGGETKLTLYFSPENDRAEVVISDDGPGIQAAHAERIFDPFFSTKKKGVGLGLAICKKIINAHGGKISFQNRTARGGAIFSVVLPCGLETDEERTLPTQSQASPRVIE